MKILPMVAELFHADPRRDGRTDRHEEARDRSLHFFERALKLPLLGQLEFKSYSHWSVNCSH